MLLILQKAQTCVPRKRALIERVSRLFHALIAAFVDPRQRLPDLSDRQARDIGLDPAELEWRRLRLPSQHCHHPRW